MNLDENLEIFEEERRRLGLQNTPIDFKIADYETEIIPATPLNILKLIAKILTNAITMKADRVPFARKMREDYLVSIPYWDAHNPELFRSRVKHELFHIADGHLEKKYWRPIRLMLYHFYQERRAVKYAKS